MSGEVKRERMGREEASGSEGGEEGGREGEVGCEGVSGSPCLVPMRGEVEEDANASSTLFFAFIAGGGRFSM